MDSTGASQANGGNAYAHYDDTGNDNRIAHPFKSYPTYASSPVTLLTMNADTMTFKYTLKTTKLDLTLYGKLLMEVTFVKSEIGN